MINLNTKAEGMQYTLNGNTYTIYHDYFKVIDFVDLGTENKYRIHIQNKDYDTIVIPFKDYREILTKQCTIKMAYIKTDSGINCHGYEVVTEDIPELHNLPAPKQFYLGEPSIDITKYKVTLYNYINSIKSDEIRRFVKNIIEKKWLLFCYTPAASSVHHNYKSGLLQHTTNVVKNAVSIAYNYSDINMDIVVAGAILHDIGKIYEYDQNGQISGEGRMFDHINIGTRIIFEEYYHGEDSVYSFSERDLYHIAHIILSHHGKLEWGSPKTPETQEALLVHYADYIDANMYISHKELQNAELDDLVKSRYLGTLLQTKVSMSESYDI